VNGDEDYVGGPWFKTVQCTSEKAARSEETNRNSDAIVGLIGIGVPTTINAIARFTVTYLDTTDLACGSSQATRHPGTAQYSGIRHLLKYSTINTSVLVYSSCRVTSATVLREDLHRM
jgi:hypothetical protein